MYMANNTKTILPHHLTVSSSLNTKQFLFDFLFQKGFSELYNVNLFYFLNIKYTIVKKRLYGLHCATNKSKKRF